MKKWQKKLAKKYKLPNVNELIISGEFEQIAEQIKKELAGGEKNVKRWLAHKKKRGFSSKEVVVLRELYTMWSGIGRN